MDLKTLHRVYAAGVFIVSLLVYWMTVQPSVSFWDCGEFIAASYYMQVPHPPGTPFFLILGNIFAKIPFFENVGFKINLISVFSSALSVFLLYLVAVKLINHYKGKKPANMLDAVVTYTAAAIGAFSLCFSDTFWFNGVEAEVYAFSTFLVAAITYLILRWMERADKPDSEKYILGIAYLVGLSTGVHLMSVLAVVPVVMIIFFRKYMEDEETLKKTAFIFLIHAGVILLLAVIWWAGEATAMPPSGEEYQEFDTKFKLMVLGISAIIMGIYWKKIFTKNSFYMPIIIGGIALFATYPGIVKVLPSIMTAIGKENIVVEIFLFVLILAILAYAVHYSVKTKKPTLHMVFMSAIFILIGFTTFSLVIIRANQNPPMNENEPTTFPALEKYLNREQYGDFPTFKRRFSSEPHQAGIYSNYNSDLDFFYSYQMNHMMTRYWLWNYAGREGWAQDDGANIAPFNSIGNIIGRVIAVNFEGNVAYSLFGIPFLLGLFGIYHHFRRDWKMAAVFMIMFILLGYLTAFYQNQQQPQPRERDYFYVGAFFVFSIWIAIGARGLIDLAQEKIKSSSIKNASIVGILIFTIILVPVRMLQANYFTHDRSKNWVPWDYSYNILQSAATNAILFTNGDNDTFPLWYLQDVEGVRRDVKVVNLSLVNTDWYIRQLKNNDPYGVGTVKIRMSETQINQLRPVQWEPTDITIGVPQPNENLSIEDIYDEYAIADSTVMKNGKLTWKMPNSLTFGDIKAIRVQDIMVREIVEANNWKRPIYFAVTCSDDSKVGLQDYLKMEGMAFRLVPEKRTPGREFVNEEVLKKQIAGSTEPSKTYKPGFRYTGLNDPSIFFDDNHIRMIQNYRNGFMRLAVHFRTEGNDAAVINTLNQMNEKLPPSILRIDNGLLFEVANLYFISGAEEKYKEIIVDVERRALEDLERNPSDVSSYYNPYRILIDTYENLKEYDKLLGIWEKLEIMFPNDPTVKANIQRYRQMLTQPDTLSP